MTAGRRISRTTTGFAPAQRHRSTAGRAHTPTLAQQRAALLGGDTVEWLRELAANAPALTNEQKDAIRAAFRGTTETDRMSDELASCGLDYRRSGSPGQLP